MLERGVQDKKVALSQDQVRMGLGLLTELELDSAKTNYQVQENALRTKQIDLFNAKNSYDWFLKGMPYSS